MSRIRRRCIPPFRIAAAADIGFGATVDAAHHLIRTMPRIIADDAPGVTGIFRLVPRGGAEGDIGFFAIDPATGAVWFKKQPVAGQSYYFNMSFESRQGDIILIGDPEVTEDLGWQVTVAPPPAPPVADPAPQTSPVSHSMLGTVSHVIDTPYPTSGLSTPPPRTGLGHFTKAYSAPQGQDLGYNLGVTHVMFVGIPEGTGLQNLPHDIAYGRGEMFNPQRSIADDLQPYQTYGRVPAITWSVGAQAEAGRPSILPVEAYGNIKVYATEKAQRGFNDYDFRTTQESAGQYSVGGIIGFHLSVDGGQSWSRLLKWVYGYEIFNLHFGQRDISVRPDNPQQSFFTTDISGPGRNIADTTVEHIWGWQQSERIWFSEGGRKLTLGGASGTIHARMENVGGLGALGGSFGQRDDTVLHDGSGGIYAVIYDYTIQQDDLADGLTLEWA